MLAASADALEDIKMDSKNIRMTDFLPLLKLRFLRLRILKLGFHCLPGKMNVDAFTEFVLSHDTLEELDIADSYYDCFVTGFNVSFLKKNSFPRPKIFRGHAGTPKQTTDARMASLRSSLCKIETWPCGLGREHSAIYSLLDSMASTTDKQPFTLNALKDLNFDLSFFLYDINTPNEDCEPTCSFIERIAVFCSRSLEVWTDRFTH